MSQHGRQRPAPHGGPTRRFGPFTAESGIVLGLIGVIAAGSLLVNTVLPSEGRTRTFTGTDQVRVTTVGNGGVQPGAIQQRTELPEMAPADGFGGAVGDEIPPVSPVVEQAKQEEKQEEKKEKKKKPKDEQPAPQAPVTPAPAPSAPSDPVVDLNPGDDEEADDPGDATDPGDQPTCDLGDILTGCPEPEAGDPEREGAQQGAASPGGAGPGADQEAAGANRAGANSQAPPPAP